MVTACACVCVEGFLKLELPNVVRSIRKTFFKSSLKFLLPVGPSSSSQSECSLAMKDPKTLQHETWLDATLV